MIIAIAEKCDICYSNKKINNFYLIILFLNLQGIGLDVMYFVCISFFSTSFCNLWRLFGLFRVFRELAVPKTSISYLSTCVVCLRRKCNWHRKGSGKDYLAKKESKNKLRSPKIFWALRIYDTITMISQLKQLFSNKILLVQVSMHK